MIILVILLTLLIVPTSWASVTCTGDTQWLSSTTLPVTAPPFTISVWFKSVQDADRAASDTLVWIGDVAATGTWFSVGLYRLGIDRLSAWHRVQDTDGETYPSVGTVVNNTWQHVIARFDSNSQRRISVDDANSATNVVEQPAVTGIDQIAICSARDSTPGFYWNGQIAEVSVWNLSLSDAQKTALAGGANPLAISPGNLVRYCTLASDATCAVGPNFTNNGSATFNAGDHPTIDAPPGASVRRHVGPFRF